MLLLGSNVLADEAVTYVRDNGGKAIVADYLSVKDSPAKALADEHFEISTADTDKLIDLCRNEKIDAVFSGISEFNLLHAMRVQERMGNRFYFNIDQWNQIEKKDLFRALCEKYDVPAPKTYFAGTIDDYRVFDRSQLVFPFVVKPVDCAASDGVTICKDKSLYDEAVEDAFKLSSCGRIIIEKYIEGYEFTAHYTIHKGKAALSTVDNRYPEALHVGSVTTVPIARVYPSLFIKPYMEKVNDKMISLCEGLDLDDAVIFIQGIYNDQEDEFYIFEAGLRPAAEAPCRFTEKLSGQNHYKMIIDRLMNVESDYKLYNEDPYMKGKVCGIVSLAGMGGVVAEINGLEAIMNKIPGLFQYESRYPIGSSIPDGNTLRQLVMRFLMICDSREEIARNVEVINNTVSLIGKDGKDLLIRINPDRILGYR